MHHFFTTISKVAGIVGILSLSVSFAATPPLLPHSAETAMKWTRTVPAQTSKTITFTTNNTDTPLLVDCGGGTLVCHTVNSFSCVYATGGTYEVILANPEALQTIQGLSTANIIAFQGGNARNLQALELNTNQLTSIDETMFSGLVQLSELNVSRNQIRTIAPNAFIHQTKLGNLHLEANSLTTITKEHLQGMPNLTYLGLDRNNLFSLDADLFDYQTSQSFGVDLWGNCLDTSTTFTTSRVNSSRKYNQNVCAIISYSPSSPTTGNVVGTVVLTGGSEEKREQIDVSNLLTHTRTGNGTWTFDLSAIPGAWNLTKTQLVGEVNWIYAEDNGTEKSGKTFPELPASTGTIISTGATVSTGTTTSTGASISTGANVSTGATTSTGAITSTGEKFATGDPLSTSTAYVNKVDDALSTSTAYINKVDDALFVESLDYYNTTIPTPNIAPSPTDTTETTNIPPTNPTSSTDTTPSVQPTPSPSFTPSASSSETSAFGGGATSSSPELTDNEPPQPFLPTSSALDEYLSRAEMANIIIAFIQLTNASRRPLTEGDCTAFSDLKQAIPELQTSIMQSCQRALMGYWANGRDEKSAFSPNALITKAEVATVISRLLRGTTYAGTEEFWYHSHLLALKKAGIMIDDTAPLNREIRKNVFAILQHLQVLLGKGE